MTQSKPCVRLCVFHSSSQAKGCVPRTAGEQAGEGFRAEGFRKGTGGGQLQHSSGPNLAHCSGRATWPVSHVGVSSLAAVESAPLLARLLAGPQLERSEGKRTVGSRRQAPEEAPGGGWPCLQSPA